MYRSLILFLATFLFFCDYSAFGQSFRSYELSWRADSLQACNKRLKDAQAITLREVPYWAGEQLRVGRGHALELTDTRVETLEAACVPAEWYAEMTNAFRFVWVDSLRRHALLPLRINAATGQVEKLTGFKLLTKYKARESRNKGAQAGFTSTTSYRFGVFRSGLHRITGKQLRSMGADLAQIDPATLQLFGNGGNMIPKTDQDGQPSRTTEVAVRVSGSEDGSFDADDAVYFYAQGPLAWRYQSDGHYHQRKNLYTDTAFYFLTYGLEEGLRVETRPSEPASAEQSYSTYHYRAYHERDLLNSINRDLKSGKDWLGESFAPGDRKRFTFELPSRVPEAPVHITARCVASGLQQSTFTIEVNGQEDEIPINAISGDYQRAQAQAREFEAAYLNEEATTFRVALTYQAAGSESEGWLDDLTLNTRAQLRYADAQLDFRVTQYAPGTFSTVGYRIAEAPEDLQVWDVTEHRRPVARSLRTEGNARLVTAPGDKRREFVAFRDQDAIQARALSQVKPSNLLSRSGAELVIIAHPDFRSYAEELAQFREANDGLSTMVVSPRAIFNAFGSGKGEPMAIRRFMRHLYLQAENASERPRYLLLFGDASYDYKDRIPGNTNYIPTYQSNNITEPLASYCSDDLYGLMEDNEVRAWVRGFDTFDLDIGVGRFPVNTVDQARALVEKMKRYEEAKAMGSWRNMLTYLADDEDNNVHLEGVEEVQSIASRRAPEYNIEKIYFDAFQQESVSSGQRYPQVTRRLNERMQQGALMVNYMGHGGERGLAHERVLSNETIDGWNNTYRMPLFVTATCEFSRFDDPEFISTGEEVLLKPGGGAIAMLTTTRLVFVFANEMLNNNFQRRVFQRLPSGEMPRLGDVVRLTKNASYSDGGQSTNTKNFSLLGDPSLQLAYPERKVRTLTFNRTSVDSAAVDTVNALDTARLSGEVLRADGKSRDTDFNGRVEVTVFDVADTLQTLANDPDSKKRKFVARESILYRGQARVEDGYFELSFITPKDLSFEIGRGKISYYAWDESQTDANGAFEAFQVGGVGSSLSLNDNPPKISLFLEDDNFQAGDAVSETPLLIARLRDDYGINMSGNGIGKNLTAQIDDEEPIVVNRFYTSDLGDYTSGEVRYQLNELAPGEHRLRFKAWDVHNNSAEASTHFVVAENPGMALEHILAYPNPARDQTTFSITHNKPGEQLELTIGVFDMQGNQIETMRLDRYSPASRLEGIQWDVPSSLSPGVYLFRVGITSENGQQDSKTERLVVIR